MSIDNLDIVKQLIAEKENGQVEFKETTGQLERGMETLCAFLNGNGGTVLFGVNDKGKIIAQYEERTAKLKADVPQLEAIIAKTWGKEDELKQLKSDLAALDRKITAELAPPHDEKNGVANSNTEGQTADAPEQSKDEKKSMVAEPVIDYSGLRRFDAAQDYGIPRRAGRRM